MSDKAIAEILDFNRNDVKLQIRGRVIARRPEVLSQVSNKIVNDATIYLRGYAEALVEHIEQPFTVKEIQDFIYDRGFEYILRRVEG